MSSLALGAGNFGTGWGHGATRDEAKEIFDGYRAAGGNFIDTANNYQSGESERLLGEFIANDRDEIVIGSKYSSGPASDSGLHELLASANARDAVTGSKAALLDLPAAPLR